MKSFRNSVAIGAAVMCSFVGAANAEQLIVFDQPLSQWNQEVSADFGVNRELGRAWVQVGLTTPAIGEEGPDTQVINRAVEGLYYDSARKQVLYRAGSEVVVCAEDAKFLWSTYLKSTGQCLLTPRSEQRKVDNGFTIEDRAFAKVAFEAQTSAQHAAITPRPMVVQ